MCLSFQAEYFPSHEYAFKLVVLTEEQFAREKFAWSVCKLHDG